MTDRNTEESAALRQAAERYEGRSSGNTDSSRIQTSVSRSYPQPFINETLVKKFPTSSATETNLFQRGNKMQQLD